MSIKRKLVLTVCAAIFVLLFHAFNKVSGKELNNAADIAIDVLLPHINAEFTDNCSDSEEWVLSVEVGGLSDSTEYLYVTVTGLEKTGGNIIEEGHAPLTIGDCGIHALDEDIKVCLPDPPANYIQIKVETESGKKGLEHAAGEQGCEDSPYKIKINVFEPVMDADVPASY